jgi:hypothetical protein
MNKRYAKIKRQDGRPKWASIFRRHDADAEAAVKAARDAWHFSIEKVGMVDTHEIFAQLACPPQWSPDTIKKSKYIALVHRLMDMPEPNVDELARTIAKADKADWDTVKRRIQDACAYVRAYQRDTGQCLIDLHKEPPRTIVYYEDDYNVIDDGAVVMVAPKQHKYGIMVSYFVRIKPYPPETKQFMQEYFPAEYWERVRRNWQEWEEAIRSKKIRPLK